MLDVKHHITRGHWGTEENVKIKIVLPILKQLGWDIIADCFFEEHKADIIVEFSGTPAFIIETKGWTQDFHYGQGLEYSIKVGTPWVIFTSGRFTEIHHALILLAKPKPVFATSFAELSTDPNAMDSLISLRAFKSGFRALHDRLLPLLPTHMKNSNAETLARAFRELRKSTDFKALARSQRTVELDEALKQLPMGMQAAYQRLLIGFERISEGSPRLRRRRTRLAFNLEVIDPKRESLGRLKWLGLIGVFPDRQTISLGLANWKILGLDPQHLATLKQLPLPTDEASAERYVSFVQECIGEISVTKQ